MRWITLIKRVMTEMEMEGFVPSHDFVLGLAPSFHHEIAVREVGVGWSRTLCLLKCVMDPRVKPVGEGGKEYLVYCHRKYGKVSILSP